MKHDNELPDEEYDKLQWDEDGDGYIPLRRRHDDEDDFDDEDDEPRESKPKRSTKRYGNKHWLAVETDWMLIMDYDEAMLWAYLLHKYKQHSADLYKGKWMWKTLEMIEHDLRGMTRPIQDRLIASLEGRGFLKTAVFSTDGERPKRHFWLFPDRVEYRIKRRLAKMRAKKTKKAL